MTNDRFNEFTAQITEHCLNVLVAKRKEYASEKDRMHNFHVSNQLQSMVTVRTPESAAWNLMSKQLVSVIDMLNDPNTQYAEYHIKEKIGDCINYLILMGGMISERGINEPNSNLPF